MIAFKMVKATGGIAFSCIMAIEMVARPRRICEASAFSMKWLSLPVVLEKPAWKPSNMIAEIRIS